MSTPIFTYHDIPETWWVRLNDDFVDELDQLNRPYKYGHKKGRRISQYWEAGELHKRTLEKMTPEEVAGYKRRHSFFEKLWGRHRWKDYHFAKDDPRRYVDTGPWITKEEIDVLREGIDIDDENMNKAITGFRVGKFSDNVREMRFKQMPIIADKWWAWMLGYYFGAGNIHSYFREGEKTRAGGFQSMYIRMRVHEPILPKFFEVATHLGMHAVHYQMSGEKYGGEGKAKIGIGKSEHIVFGWPEFLVLEKFGLPTEFLGELENRKDYQLASSGYKPKIPDWILSDDDYMQYFIEGYMTTGKSQSTLGPAEQAGGLKIGRAEIIFNGIGYPDEAIKTFMQQIHLWFTRQGIIPGFTEEIAAGKDRHNYRLHITSHEGYVYCLNAFDIHKPEMRARLYIMLESYDDPVINEALRVLENPENVVLGMLLEQPMTAEETAFDLRMYPDTAFKALENLVRMGLAVKELDHYHYEPMEFVKNTIEKYKDLAEEKRQRMTEYATRLLHQCQGCRQVYVTERSECGLCGNQVIPVPRRSVLGRLDRQRMYNMYLARMLEDLDGGTSR